MAYKKINYASFRDSQHLEALITPQMLLKDSWVGKWDNVNKTVEKCGLIQNVHKKNRTVW